MSYWEAFENDDLYLKLPFLSRLCMGFMKYSYITCLLIECSIPIKNFANESLVLGVMRFRLLLKKFNA